LICPNQRGVPGGGTFIAKTNIVPDDLGQGHPCLQQPTQSLPKTPLSNSRLLPGKANHPLLWLFYKVKEFIYILSTVLCPQSQHTHTHTHTHTHPSKTPSIHREHITLGPECTIQSSLSLLERHNPQEILEPLITHGILRNFSSLPPHPRRQKGNFTP
jgi:hypothetical protein